MNEIVVKGLKGKKKDTLYQIGILALVYLSGVIFLVFESNFIKSRQTIASYYDNIPFIDSLFEDGKIMILLLGISGIMMGISVINLSQKRKYTLQMLRGLGADVMKLILYVTWENLYLWGVGFLIGVSIGSVLAILLLFIVTSAMSLPFLIAIPWAYLGEYLLFTCGLFFIGTLLLVFQIWNSGISSSFKEEYNVFELENVPALKKAEKISFLRWYKRKRLFYIGSTGMRMGVSIVVIIVSAVNIHLFCVVSEQYQIMKNLSSSAYVFSTPNLGEGLTEEQILELENMEEVRSVEREKYINTGSIDANITVSFPGWKGSEYVKTHRKYAQTVSGMEGYDKEGDYFVLNEIRGISKDDEEHFAYYEQTLDAGTFHKENFNKGKECILFLSPYQVRDVGYDMIDKEAVYVTDEEIESQKVYEYKIDENSIQPGDYVTVNTPWGSSDIRVAGIVCSKYSSQMGSNIIAVGEKFLDQITRADESRYNAIRITALEEADANVVYEIIRTYFEQINPEHHISDEGAVYKEIAADCRQEMVQYPTIICVIWLLYFIVIFYANNIHLENEKRRIGILRFMGMSCSKIKQIYTGENVLEMLSVLGTGFLILLIWFLWKLREDTSFDSLESLILEAGKNQDRIEVFVLALGISFVIVLGMSLLTLVLPLRKITKGSIIENLRKE